MSLQKLIERLKDRALIEMAEGKKLYTPEEVFKLCAAAEVMRSTLLHYSTPEVDRTKKTWSESWNSHPATKALAKADEICGGGE